MRIDLAKLKTMATGGHFALDLGKAAEHLVCADLILGGHRCYLSDQGLPYDVIVDVSGRLIRIQVKAACFPRPSGGKDRARAIAYCFYVRRSGKDGKKRLGNSDCDVVALVALDIGAIAYLPVSDVGATCQLMRPDHPFKNGYKRRHLGPITDFPFASALKKLKVRSHG